MKTETYRCILLEPPFPSMGKGQDRGAKEPIKSNHPTFILPRQRLRRNPVHGSRASPRTGLLDRKFKYLSVRHFDKLSAGSELVEGLRPYCDTIFQGEGVGELVGFFISRQLTQPQPQFSKE
jgi:hypothetical protein